MQVNYLYIFIHCLAEMPYVQIIAFNSLVQFYTDDMVQKMEVSQQTEQWGTDGMEEFSQYTRSPNNVPMKRNNTQEIGIYIS